MKTALPRTVIIFGMVSLLNDAASEMITPLLPLFLTVTLGATPAILGLIEGAAEAITSVLKLYSGRLADRGWNSKGLVIGGYAISNIARPLIGLALGWPFVLVLRFLDRVGKGLRTAPRDALLAAAVDSAQRGRAFGFHRAMDHAGAMLGPLFAFGLLQAGVPMREVFMISALFGLAVMMLLLWGIPSTAPLQPVAPPRLRWRDFDRRLRTLIIAAGGLALAAAPEVFIVLWASSHGVTIVWVPLLWAAAHAVKAVIANFGGVLSDRVGRLRVVAVGWSLRAVMLFALALYDGGVAMTWTLFIAFAAASALSEGAERALIGDVAAPEQKASAFGLFYMISGLAALPGALLFGVLWQYVSMSGALLVSALLTALCATFLMVASRIRST